MESDGKILLRQTLLSHNIHKNENVRAVICYPNVQADKETPKFYLLAECYFSFMYTLWYVIFENGLYS